MKEKKTKIIKVEKLLRKKVGLGEISETAILYAESVIRNNTVDFSDIALKILSKLRASIALAQSNPHAMAFAKDGLVDAIMQLKANAPMFKFELVGHLASIVLSFLEHIEKLDADAISIVDAHEKTLSLIITKQIKGEGGALGAQLISELENACARYYRKNPDKFKRPI